MLAADVRPVPWTARPSGTVLKALWAWIVAESAAATRWLARAVCGLRGHEMILHFETNRMSLHCLSCGHESPGWTIEDRRAA